MILTAAALATIIAAGAMNLRANNRLIKTLAERGYQLKRSESCQFKSAVRDHDWLNLIPVINLFYQFGHSANKGNPTGQRAIFGELAANGALERLDETKNEVLKKTDARKRGKTVMKWRIREALGLDPITNRDRQLIAGATLGSKVKSVARTVFREPGRGWGRSPQQKREERIRQLLASADEDTLREFEELLREPTPEKRKGK